MDILLKLECGVQEITKYLCFIIKYFVSPRAFFFNVQQHKNKTELVNSSGSKWSFFIVQKLALHKNAVEFRQQFNGAICTSLATPYNDVRRRAT